ncbi:PDZ domain-containing protein [Alkalisalibacterium limincola]|uniref:PDZ domain-containing protein n=1 Tax=Alkalisalibacterium limincola TaxID=2699169 RepID=A0A5C8KWM6_9GAMM|nr:PDZ domain-containing protein [Alkalisalibacterium limincola]TXK65050.1 PDZ domain-containing protein [Alkalisalibacterium limincola]
MNHIRTILYAALASAVMAFSPAAPAAVQDPDDSATASELAEARRDLADAARRLAQLSQRLGQDAQRISIEHMQLVGGDRPRLGVVLGGGPAGGVAVRGVTPEGPAAEAGLRSGDVIESIDGHLLSDADAAGRVRQAREHLSGLEDGQSVTLLVRRDGEVLQLGLQARTMPSSLWAGGLDAVIDTHVRERLQSLGNLRDLGLVPPDLDLHIGPILPFAGCGEDVDGECRAPRLREALRWRALNLATVEAGLGRYFGVDRGVLVVSSDSRLQGLEAGDVILSIDGTEVGSPAEAMRELSRHPSGTSIPLRIQRDGEARDVTLTAPAADSIGRLLQLRPDRRHASRS